MHARNEIKKTVSISFIHNVVNMLRKRLFFKRGELCKLGLFR